MVLYYFFFFKWYSTIVPLKINIITYLSLGLSKKNLPIPSPVKTCNNMENINFTLVNVKFMFSCSWADMCVILISCFFVCRFVSDGKRFAWACMPSAQLPSLSQPLAAAPAGCCFDLYIHRATPVSCFFLVMIKWSWKRYLRGVLV